MLLFSVPNISYIEILIINKEKVKEYKDAISIVDKKIRYTNVNTHKGKEELQVNRKISYLYVFFFFHLQKQECRSPPTIGITNFKTYKLGGN